MQRAKSDSEIHFCTDMMKCTMDADLAVQPTNKNISQDGISEFLKDMKFLKR